MADLLAGEIILAADTPPTVSDREDAAFNATGTAYAAGATVCGVAFTAPTTGRVMIHWSAYLDNTITTASTHMSVRVGTGSSVGAGTQFLAPSDSLCIMNVGSDQRQYGTSYLLTGLTAGAAYNVQTMHRVSAGTADLANRHVMVAPTS